MARVWTRVEDHWTAAGVRFDANLTALDESEIWVGLRAKESFGAFTERDNSDLLVIASSNEFGTADGRVPERSFMRSTIDEKADTYVRLFGRAIANAHAELDLQDELELIGMRAVRDIQRKMRSDVPPPNAPSTIRRKKSSKTLRDTGRLIQSIDYEVVMPKGSR